jgi:F-type H+-transporting ATPase subunit gamma
MAKNASAGSVGFVVVTTDKGLCGGMNTNLLHALTARFKEVETSGRRCEAVAIGGKGLGFLNRIGARVLLHETRLGDEPRLERLVGPTKVMLDAYAAGRLSAVYLCYTRFVNTIRQEPVIQLLLPLSSQQVGGEAAPGGDTHTTDYLYEPDAQTLVEQILLRYVEALVFQAVAENMASEQAARMVAMKAATDNGASLIGELTLLHNRTRQAAITRELSEIVGGAAAV